MERFVGRTWSSYTGVFAIGFVVFGLSLLGATVNGGLGLLPVQVASSADLSAVVDASDAEMTDVDAIRSPTAVAAPPLSPEQRAATDQDKVELFADEVRHVGRVISSTAVATNSDVGSSRGGGTLQLGDPCSCDQDCDPALGDQCNIVQCVVRSVCDGDNQTPCTPGDPTACTGNG